MPVPAVPRWANRRTMTHARRTMTHARHTRRCRHWSARRRRATSTAIAAIRQKRRIPIRRTMIRCSRSTPCWQPQWQRRQFCLPPTPPCRRRTYWNFGYPKPILAADFGHMSAIPGFLVLLVRVCVCPFGRVSGVLKQFCVECSISLPSWCQIVRKPCVARIAFGYPGLHPPPGPSDACSWREPVA